MPPPTAAPIPADWFHLQTQPKRPNQPRPRSPAQASQAGDNLGRLFGHYRPYNEDHDKIYPGHFQRLGCRAGPAAGSPLVTVRLCATYEGAENTDPNSVPTYKILLKDEVGAPPPGGSSSAACRGRTGLR